MHPSTSPSRIAAWSLLFIASLFYAYQYILRVMPNIMLSDITEQFNMGAATFGQFSGIYYIGYSLIHLPVGIMLDRYGPKKVMSGAILLSVAGLTPLIFASHWAYPIAGRLLIGVGSSAAILGVFKIIRMSFEEKLFPKMLSIAVTIGLIGAVYGGGPVSYMRELLGYQAVVQAIALVGILLALATYLMIPRLKEPAKAPLLANIKEVVSNKKVIYICLFAGLMVGPLEGFADVWATLFLKQAKGFNANLAATMPSMIFIGMCFGSPILNFIADKTKSYLGTIVGAGITMALFFLLLLASSFSSFIVSASFILIGVCCSYQILAIYKASTYVREEVAGLTTAMANMIIMLFGYLFHALIGSTVNAMGGLDAPYALEAGIAVIPFALFLGTVGFIWISLTEKKLQPAVYQN